MVVTLLTLIFIILLLCVLAWGVMTLLAFLKVPNQIAVVIGVLIAVALLLYFVTSGGFHGLIGS